jgi:UDP-glucose 4-epimerase
MAKPALTHRYALLGSVVVLFVLYLLLGGTKKTAAKDWKTCKQSQPLVATDKKVLVTGAAGFIGSHVARHCAELGMEVIAIDDMSGGFYENIPRHSKVKFFKADIKDADYLEEIFQKHGPFHYVYHLAAYAAEGLSHFIPSYNYRNNLVGSIEVLSLAVKHKTEVFVFTSSIAVYGSVPDDMAESVEPTPEDPYGVSKFAVELHLRSAHEIHGMQFIIFRPHNVYGPNQNIADKYRNVVGIFMNEIILKKPLTIFGDGLQTRSFSYIDDVAPVIAKAPLYPHARNEIFNVGADDSYTLNHLSVAVSKAMGVTPNVLHLDARKEVVHSAVSNAKVRCFFGLGAPTSLETGLQKTAEWVKAIGQHYLPVEFRAVEILTHMPPSWVRPDLKQASHIVHDAKDNPRAVEYETRMYPSGVPKA